jgi:hypothetical protein
MVKETRDSKRGTLERWGLNHRQRSVGVVAVLTVIFSLLWVPTAFAATYCCRQIGASGTDTNAYYSQAAATTMTPPAVNPYRVDSAVAVYWVGLILSSGSFVQAGYLQHAANCPNGNDWFFQAFDPNGNQIIDDQGGCGLVNSRTFSVNMRFSGYVGSTYEIEWNAEVSGLGVVGHTYYDQKGEVDSGPNIPYAISELTGPSTPSTSDVLAGVEYSPAIDYSQSGAGGSTYNAIQSAVVYRNSYGVCPPYEVFNDNLYNEFRDGSVYSSGCWSTGRSLW